MTVPPSPPPPYHEAPGSSHATRRLLLIAPAFPPCAEVGALRWQKIAEIAAERGWRLDVITGAAGPQDRMDDSRLLTLPAGTRVWSIPLRTTVPERLQLWVWSHVVRRLRGSPASGAAADASPALAPSSPHRTPAANAAGAPPAGSPFVRTLRARNHFAAWRLWRDDVVQLATRIARADVPDVVASSGPPHLAHEAARATARTLGRPLLIDLRDPMFVDHAEPAFLASDIWKRETARHEALACSDAALVVVNTQASAALLRARYPAYANKILVVMNGADPEVRAFAGSGDRFRILHAGNLYGGRDPRVLFRGVRRFLDRAGGNAGDVSVEFLGGTACNGVPLAEIAAAEGIGEYFSSEPPVPRHEALRRLGAAAVLVVLPQAWALSVPAKVFEYMQFDAALLALCDQDDATAQLLAGSDAHVVRASDPEAIAAILTRRYAAWRRGERAVAVNADGRFDRRRQADLLLDALDALP